MEQYFLNYASLQQQRWMISDRPRTDAFAKAIKEVVKPGDVVVDVGAGTGVLSMLAAKAGARKVIGVERSEMAKIAHELVNRNGLKDTVEIVNGDAKDLKLDEPVDVIISEWLGHMAYVECMFPSVIQVRDSWLKPGGILLPSGVDVFIAPVDDGELYNEFGPGFWGKSHIHGLDFSYLTEKELEMGHANQLLVPDKFLLAEGKRIHHLETNEAAPGDEWCSGTVDFEIQRNGTLNGFVGWFHSQLSPNVLLDTAPACPRTHWEQNYFPFHPIKVEKGQKISLDYQMSESYEGSRSMALKLQVASQGITYIVD